MSHEPESPSNFWAKPQEILFRTSQLIDLRLALAIGLVAFLVVVGFDSAGNRAEAADLEHRSGFHSALLIPVVTAFQDNRNDSVPPAPGLKPSGAENDAHLATARRLRHGTLTSAVMTSSRLTQAHFFTDLPSQR